MVCLYFYRFYCQKFFDIDELSGIIAQELNVIFGMFTHSI